jgi:sugar O-acyltransferase (sialic acid O-acetyltransferase NeuD family)
MSNLVIFGTGKIADEAYHYISSDSEHKIVAFTVDRPYLSMQNKFGLPVVAFDEIDKHFPPTSYDMFVAVGYQNLNHLRADKYFAAKAKGYKLISYICSRATNFGNVPIGDNCFILENAALQPCCSIGNNVFIWSGNHIGHHARVEDHCYLCGQVVVSGNSVIEPYCFLGVNSTIGHEVTVGRESLIGAGALITKDVAPKSVHIVSDTPKFRLDSESFLKLTKMK